MSITIIKQPSDLTPVYNPMVIAVTGSYQTQTNFQFIAEISAKGDVLTRLKVPVNPEGYGVFDIHRHVENKITYDFNPEWYGWNTATNSFSTYSVSFSQEFRYEWEFYDNTYQGGFVGFVGLTGGDEPLFDTGDSIIINQYGAPTNIEYNGAAIITGITLSGSNWIITTDKPWGVSTPAEGGLIYLPNFDLTTVDAGDQFSSYAWNGVFNFLDFINYDYTNYLPSTASNGQWLTTMPDNWEVGTQSRVLFLTYRDDYADQENLVIQSNTGTFRIPSNSYTYGSQIDINSYTDNGGNVRFNCSSAHGLTLGDTFEVFQSPYNGVYEAIEINSSTQVTGNVTWTGSGVLGAEYLKKITGGLLDENTMRIVGVGPYELLTYTSSIVVSSGSLPIIDSDTVTYSVWTEDVNGDQDIATKVFKMKDWCSKYEQIQLVFMDKLGSFVPYTFNRVNRNNKTIEKNRYQQFYGEYAPASNSWTYNTWDRGIKTLDVRVSERYTITSDWVNQTTSDYLMELFESTEVYWIKEDGVTIAIDITTSQVERKQVINDQLINYTLDFVVANRDMKQKG